MERNEEMAAYPSTRFDQRGLTKRELAAIKAMQGLVQHYGLAGDELAHVAQMAVRQADALLAALATSANLKEPQHGTE
jgi:hypothetical protein